LTRDGQLATALLAFELVCLVGLYLNHTQRSSLAAYILSVVILIGIDYAIYKGIGLHDSIVMAFPIFVLSVTFLFGTRGFISGTTLSILSMVSLYYLELAGFIVSTYHTSINRVYVLSLILIVMAATTWVVRETWETNLNNLRDSYEQTLVGWARALEYRDGETEGHSKRTTKLCISLAKKLGFEGEDLSDIRRGAYLHDIGKMAIPDSILLKPGPLNDDEWAVMKMHPVLSKQLITEIPFLQSAVDIPYSHHEKWDGSGYPQGLKGEEIPIPARIFAVVDYWDALTSDRPYRSAWQREKVIAYLKENTGKIFDPHIVEVFLTLV